MTTGIDLRELAARESEQVEWKENVADVDGAVATLSAFANDWSNLGGGYVVCGAKEEKDEHGFPRVVMTGLTATRLKEVEGRVTTRCRERVSPAIVPLVVELETTDNDRRVLVFVMPATQHAHTFRRDDDSGKHYVRVSRETREARNGVLRELLVRKGALEPWDRRPCTGATVNDLDLLALRDGLQRMAVFDPARGVEYYLSETTQLSPFVPSLCLREPLTQKLRPRNFAMLLFGRQPQAFLPGAFSLFSAYPGTDRSEPHAERHEIPGNIVDQARRLIDLLNLQALTAFDKRDVNSPNVLKYPQRALQEATVNAVAHRDYESPDPVRVTVFSDRVETVSPGGLPLGLSLDEFRAGRATAKWRNQSLAWFLNRLQLAQAEGQGIPTILRVMREEGCPPPVFEATSDRVTCVLPAHPRHAAIREHHAIEQGISLGELAPAREKVLALLARDPFDFRSVQLLTEIQRALGDAAPVADFVRCHETELEIFSPIALLYLADALSTLARPGSSEHGLARRLIATATTGRFEEREARRAVVTLLRLKEDSEALALIGRLLREHPDWANSAALLQLRGRTLLQLAKRCGKTLRNQSLPKTARERAQRDLEDYLARSTKDLNDALTHAPDATVSDLAKDDLRFIETLRSGRRRRRPTRY